MTQPSPHRAVCILFLTVLMAPFQTGAQQSASSGPARVWFPSGSVTLGGTVYKPQGEGPFPTVVYNHGSAPGSVNDLAFEQLGPLFVQHGWVFFAPYRRGQGLSAAAGPYVVQVLQTDQLADHLAAYDWLKRQSFVDADRIATAGIPSEASSPCSQPSRFVTAPRLTLRVALRTGRRRWPTA